MSPLRAYTHTHIKIETDKSLTKLRQTTHVTSTCVYTHTLKRSFLYAQLYVLSFDRIEADNSCHFYVCAYYAAIYPVISQI